MQIQETESSGKARLKLIVNAIALPQFVVILEKGFNPNLLFPNLGPHASLDTFNTANSVIRRD